MDITTLNAMMKGTTLVYVCPPVTIRRIVLLSDNGCRITINGIVVSDTRGLIEHNANIAEPINVTLIANRMNMMKVEWIGNMHNDLVQILDYDSKLILDERYVYPCKIDI